MDVEFQQFGKRDGGSAFAWGCQWRHIVYVRVSDGNHWAELLYYRLEWRVERVFVVEQQLIRLRRESVNGDNDTFGHNGGGAVLAVGRPAACVGSGDYGDALARAAGPGDH